jgi:predicted tellurium resistance membrane protein TerC
MLLIRVKAAFVRFILIGLLFFSAFSLLTKGLYNLDVMGEVPIAIVLGVLGIDAAIIILAIFGKLPKLRRIRR